MQAQHAQEMQLLQDRFWRRHLENAQKQAAVAKLRGQLESKWL
jgi:hypothetical protein